MVVHIAIGKEMCHAVWDDDFSKVIELSINGNGDIVTLDIEDDTTEDYTSGSDDDWRIVRDDQMKIIKKLGNNI
jgi:hypothetical protein